MRLDPIVFSDASFYTAMLLSRDSFHGAALKWAAAIEKTKCRIVTTEGVLWELLNSCASPASRDGAMDVYRRLHQDPTVDVIGFEDEWMNRALDLYQHRPDKAWGVTDCMSFAVMTARGLTQALTTDRHFGQAGFDPLMLQAPPTIS